LALTAIAAVLVVTCIRIALTHAIFSPTWDEPEHVRTGWEYLAKHQIISTEHPPLARIVAAFPLRHARIIEGKGQDFVQIYESASDYMKGVVASRRGILLFVVIAIAGVAWWAWELFGKEAAVVAAILFAMLPPILAHGGLATTDMAVTAAFPVAMAAFERWIGSPTWPWTIALGIAIGFGLAVKFSFPFFFAIGAVAVIIAARSFPFGKALIAALIGFSILWLIYRCEHRRLYKIEAERAPAMAVEIFGSDWIARAVRFPAPRYFLGLMELKIHDLHGHPVYFLGKIPLMGTWSYFPVVLGVKTPIPFLLLSFAGGWLVFRERKRRHLVIIAAGLLALSMTSHINLGVRHILPIYAPMSIIAAHAVVCLWSLRTARAAVAVLGAWLVIGSLTAHPDYLPWMNAFAGRHPENVVLDSNFDWGQDVLRLRDECRRLGIKSLGVDVFGTNDLHHLGFPPTHPIDPLMASTGWLAVSEDNLHTAQARDPNKLRWLTDPFHFRRVGKSIRLYHVPE
jgi:hypothetical protein